ncbi:MAG: DNA polymerase III subunit delta [Candidatus Omnitrophica bacterium]|nr:DNA polymerase III subunit delta [Candidatus Omnitrophota bacterium]
MVIAPVTLLAGKETAERDDEIRRVRSTLFKDPSQAELNLHVFDLREDSAQNAVSAGLTAPFLASKRLVIIHHIDAADESGRKALQDAPWSAASTTVWILTTEEKKPRNAFLKKMFEKSTVILCETPFRDSDIKGWIRRRFSLLGKTAGEGVPEMMLSRTGRSLTLLRQAVETLALYTADKKRIEADDAAALLGPSAEENVFDLYESLKTGRYEKARQILDALGGAGSRPQEILASLIWQYDRILRTRNLLSQGLGTADLVKALKMPAYFAGKTAQFASRMPEEDFRRDLDALYECETDIKRGRVREDLALERCLLRLSQV